MRLFYEYCAHSSSLILNCSDSVSSSSRVVDIQIGSSKAPFKYRAVGKSI